MYKRFTLVIVAVGCLGGPLIADAAEAPAKVGQSCKSNQVGKTSGILTCKRIRGKTTWVSSAPATTAVLTTNAPITIDPSGLNRSATLRIAYSIALSSWDPSKMTSGASDPVIAY